MVTIWVLSGFKDPHSVRNVGPLPEAATNLELGGEPSHLLQGLPGLAAAGWCSCWGATAGDGSLCPSKSGSRWEERLSSQAMLVSQTNVFGVHWGNQEGISRAMSDKWAVTGIVPDLGHASPCNRGVLISSDSLVFNRLWMLMLLSQAILYLTGRRKEETSTVSTLLCTMWFLVPSSLLIALAI